jgi:hypothetical protein
VLDEQVSDNDARSLRALVRTTYTSPLFLRKRDAMNATLPSAVQKVALFRDFGNIALGVRDTNEADVAARRVPAPTRAMAILAEVG